VRLTYLSSVWLVLVSGLSMASRYPSVGLKRGCCCCALVESSVPVALVSGLACRLPSWLRCCKIISTVTWRVRGSRQSSQFGGWLSAANRFAARFRSCVLRPPRCPRALAAPRSAKSPAPLRNSVIPPSICAPTAAMSAGDCAGAAFNRSSSAVSTARETSVTSCSRLRRK